MFAHASLNLFTTFLAKYKEMGGGGGGWLETWIVIGLKYCNFF